MLAVISGNWPRTSNSEETTFRVLPIKHHTRVFLPAVPKPIPTEHQSSLRACFSTLRVRIRVVGSTEISAVNHTDRIVDILLAASAAAVSVYPVCDEPDQVSTGRELVSKPGEIPWLF